LVLALSAMSELFRELRMTSPTPGHESRAPRLLVADDQPAVLEALRWLLAGEGYDPHFVGSTGAVVERLNAEPYDLLLMDLNYSRDTTSGREGLDLIPRVRKIDPSLPIVVMTGWGSIDTAVEAMRLGARSFVQKPWDDVTLLEIVAREIADARAARRRDHQQEREREEARLIQRGLLPRSVPQTPGIDLAVAWQPAEGVGGDCFDTIAFGDAVGVSVADIAGKGMPAALLMSNLQAAVRAFALDAAAPSAICGSVNRLLCRNMASGRFATFCYARINAASGRVAYANAGHNPPLLIRRDGTIEALTKGGMVLGVFPETAYEQAEVAIATGDRLVFYTDGITEARNAEGDEYGDDRLLAAALAVRAQPAEAIKTALLDDVNRFTGGQFEDDATLIVVAVTGC
jgi:sigma-B regulation protein RsbU (phosphoserine phosphatase)